MKQFVIDSASVCGEKAVIRGKDFHYLVHVRRCRVGSRFSVVDETGRRYEASVTVISPDECVLTLTAAGDVPGGEKPETELVLIQCLPKAKKMDLIVRQAAEAAVSRVIPAESRYCVSRPDPRSAASKAQRWRIIAREAVQQSGSAVGTTVDGVVPLAEAAEKVSDCDCRLFFHHLPLPQRVRLHDAVPGAKRIAFVIGPEGGLDGGETEMLLQKGFRPVYLGRNILRCETAPLYAAAAVSIILEECQK